MAKFTATVPLNIKWNGLEISGAAGATHRIPDALYEEFNGAYAGVIPGLTWLSTDEIGGVLSNISLTGAGAASVVLEAKITGDTVARLALKADGVIEAGGGGSTRDTSLYRSAADFWRTDDSFQVGTGTVLSPTGFVHMTEISDPGNPADLNTARLYIRDNGSGKTQLVVVFNTGAVQVLATQP